MHTFDTAFAVHHATPILKLLVARHPQESFTFAEIRAILKNTPEYSGLAMNGTFIRNVMHELVNSRSWTVISPLKNCVRGFSHLCGEKQ